ncbi:MAG: HTH domain-containing protein [Methanocellales archaeon]|nr:HTH domain-containing protein [Methanocellales archaeon]MDD3421213.1 HTH domain-containing protein [Methanocellales archaeon]MDD4898462.1 HTH domain-containing protein [Methanocellales archaeon]MDD5447059.1 HTH domain-containing protein [Methanocellales archaeon]
MIEIKCDSLDESVLRALLLRYPITLSELQKELGISDIILNRRIKSLQKRGILALDILPDKTFVQLLRTDFRFVRFSNQQRRAFKRKLTKKKPRENKKIRYG